MSALPSLYRTRKNQNTWFIKASVPLEHTRVSRFNASISDKKMVAHSEDPNDFVEVSNINFTVRIYADGRLETLLNDRNIIINNPEWRSAPKEQ